MKSVKLFSVFLVLLLIVPWSVAYAARAEMASVKIEVPEPSSAPGMVVFGKAAGNLSTGDLFYIEADDADDITATLYLANASELIPCYRNLNIQVGSYSKDDGGVWEKACGYENQSDGSALITLRNSNASFHLSGEKITIDGGSYYCLEADVDASKISPRFYLEVSGKKR